MYIRMILFSQKYDKVVFVGLAISSFFKIFSRFKHVRLVF